jgi:molybdenum-dependent DNA-binding transcriptional regulator ModE
MKGHKCGIGSRKADRIILALLEHGSIQKAAAALGMSDVTLWRRLRKPEFQEAYRLARREAFSQSMGRLQHAAGAAASTLLRIVVDKEAPAGTRVRAAHCVLEHAANAFELEDLDVRLARLER